ncbi:DUF4360 domain-containing protein, partial [Actinomadura rubrisoli]
GVTVEIATINGSGCSAGAMAVSLDQNLALTVRSAGYRAQAGGTSLPADAQKRCQISMRLHVPQGYTYAFQETEHSGSAQLEPGAIGVLKIQHYFQGMPQSTPTSHTLRGPYSGGWQITGKSPELIYKPCGEERNFNIATELRVDPGTSDPSKTSSMDFDRSTYRFDWKRCP